MVRCGPGSQVLAATRVKWVLRQRLLAHVSIVTITQGTRGAWCSIRRGVASQRHCAFCSISVGDTCMTEHDGLLLWEQLMMQFLQPAPLPQQTRSSIVTLRMSRATLLGGTQSVSFLVRGPRTCLVTFLPSPANSTLAWSSTATPAVGQVGLRSKSQSLLRTPVQERSVQRADVRHDGFVQVDGRPVRGLRRKTQPGHPDTQTTRARGEFGPFPCQLRDIAAK